MIVLNIEIEALVGAAAGAITLLIVLVPFAAMLAAMESCMALGGPGGFLKTLGIGAAIYMPVGAVTGIIVVLAGGPWWAAIPASVGVFWIICAVGQRKSDRRDR